MTAPKDCASSAEPRDLSGQVILIAHGDSQSLEKFRLRLESAGAEVCMASSTADALKALNRFNFSLAILAPTFLTEAAPLAERLTALKLPFAALVSATLNDPAHANAHELWQIGFHYTIDEILSILPVIHHQNQGARE